MNFSWVVGLEQFYIMKNVWVSLLYVGLHCTAAVDKTMSAPSHLEGQLPLFLRHFLLQAVFAFLLPQLKEFCLLEAFIPSYSITFMPYPLLSLYGDYEVRK